MNAVNQTELPIEKGYPERLTIDLADTDWDVEVPDYLPLIHPDFPSAQEILEEKDLTVKTSGDLARMATLSNRQAISEYGTVVMELRHPLGRTGINGTGIFWHAGESNTSDVAVYANDDDGSLNVLLVFNRNKWSLPGGFRGEEDKVKGDEIATCLNTGLRELTEETSLDLTEFNARGALKTLIDKQVKPQSRRSVDLAYISSYVATIMLPEPLRAYEVRPGDDAEKVRWVTLDEAIQLRKDGLVSSDHFSYILRGANVHLDTRGLLTRLQ